MSLMFVNKGLKSREDHIAGTVTILSSSQASVPSNSWIIDTGATYHMCSHLHIIHSLRNLSIPIRISLLNGNVSRVNQLGSVILSPNLVLHNVLYVPNF